MAHDYGCVVMIDGAQSLSSFKIDVQELDCDFLQSQDIKLLHPTGVGAIYIKRNFESVRPYQTGGAVINSVDFKGELLFELSL